jgi:hypothetical protein
MNKPDNPSVKWFGIRSVYLFGQKKDGTNIFEERVVVFSATTEEEAFAKAEEEAEQYAGANDMARHPVQVAFEQEGSPLIEGYEVWSELYESSEDLQTFVKSRYENYEFHPDS